MSSQNNLKKPLVDQVDNPYDQADPNPPSFQQPAYDLPADKDVRASFVADANPIIEQKAKLHGRSLGATVVLLFGIAMAIGTAATYPPDTDGQATSAFGYFFVCYIAYLLISMIRNDLYQYLSNISHGTKFEEEYNNVRAIIGHFRFDATCYHYQTIHHTRYITDSYGNTRTEHYTTTEKVITHTAVQNLCPKYTKDDSGSPAKLQSDTRIVFIHNKILYRFIDEASRDKFDKEYYRFRIRHTRDAHQDFSYAYILPGLKDKMTFFVGELECKMMHWLIFFALIGGIWFYSIWVERRIRRFSIEFLKILTL